jgi:hypothetical protein
MLFASALAVVAAGAAVVSLGGQEASAASTAPVVGQPRPISASPT